MLRSHIRNLGTSMLEASELGKLSGYGVDTIILLEAWVGPSQKDCNEARELNCHVRRP